MATFKYSFTVNAPLAAVSEFHHDTAVLKRLTPPPIIVQLHDYEPLGEDSRARFTLWFGPVPIRWEAIHVDVGRHGFTDVQVKGPLKRWRHTHRFSAISEGVTRVEEEIQYEHHGGLKGLISRLLFSRLGLYLLFTARKLLTRKHVKGSRQLVGRA